MQLVNKIPIATYFSVLIISVILADLEINLEELQRSQDLTRLKN